MARHWHKLIDLGSHGARLNELQLQVGEIIKSGGILTYCDADGKQLSETIAPTPKGGLPNNLKLRYTLHTLAFSPAYHLGVEPDPSKKVADKAWGICKQLHQENSSYLIPISYDAAKRDAIVHLAARSKAKILSDDFARQFIDPQNVLRFVKENRLASKVQRKRAARNASLTMTKTEDDGLVIGTIKNVMKRSKRNTWTDNHPLLPLYQLLKSIDTEDSWIGRNQEVRDAIKLAAPVLGPHRTKELGNEVNGRYLKTKSRPPRPQLMAFYLETAMSQIPTPKGESASKAKFCLPLAEERMVKAFLIVVEKSKRLRKGWTISDLPLTDDHVKIISEIPQSISGQIYEQYRCSLEICEYERVRYSRASLLGTLVLVASLRSSTSRSDPWHRIGLLRWHYRLRANLFTSNGDPNSTMLALLRVGAGLLQTLGMAHQFIGDAKEEWIEAFLKQQPKRQGISS